MKKIIWLILVMMTLNVNVMALGSNEVEQFKKSGAYDTFKITEEYFEDFDSISIVEGFLKGNPFDERKILKKLIDMLFGHSQKVIKSFMFLIICGIVVSFIANAGASLNEKKYDAGSVAGYIIFASALISFFCELVNPAKSAITDMSVMIKSLFMILITSVGVSGGIITTGLMQNVMMLSVSVITDIVCNILMPVIVFSVAISAAGNMSDKMKTSNLIKLMRSFVKWTVSFLMIFFVGLFGIYGVSGASIDACVGKTAKFLIGSSVPVVGGIVSDSMGTVLATVKAVRNITGNVGIISVVLMALTPIVRTVIYIWSLKLCAGILEPVSESNIIKLINDVTESVTLILICLISVTLLFVCCIAIVLMSANMLE